jgi:hypothetical protein
VILSRGASEWPETAQPRLPTSADPVSRNSKTPNRRPARIRDTQETAGRAYRRYLDIVRKLPATEESMSYGTPAIKVKGKLLSRLRTEAEGALALRCDFLDRQILLQVDPEVFFLTDHYRCYPWILVRLDRIPSAALADVVLRAWRLVAPKKLIDAHEDDNSSRRD